MELPTDLFTFASLQTLSGATTATYVISNTIQHIFRFNPKWLALLIAEIICLSIVLIDVSQSSGQGTTAYSSIFIAIINGFLIYTSVVGISQITSSATGNNQILSDQLERGDGDAKNLKQRSFFSPWF